MSRWRGGDLVALSAGAVVVGGSLMPWLVPDYYPSAADAAQRIALLARIGCGVLGGLMIWTATRRRGWTADLLVACAGGTAIAVVASAGLVADIHTLGLGVYLTLAGSLTAIGAALLNVLEYETHTRLRLIQGGLSGPRTGPKPGAHLTKRSRSKGANHARSQVRNPRTRAHTSDGRS